MFDFPPRRLRRLPRGFDRVAAGVVVALVIIGARLLTAAPDAAEAAPRPAPSFADVTGPARVVDGDGLWIDGVEIRLHGIDAFELRQTCADTPCGIEARRALHGLVGDRPVACEFLDQDRYGRQVSRCFVDDVDLGAALVRRGHALAYTQYSSDYVDDEAAARVAGAGAWAGEFTAPSDWRRARG